MGSTKTVTEVLTDHKAELDELSEQIRQVARDLGDLSAWLHREFETIENRLRYKVNHGELRRIISAAWEANNSEADSKVGG